MGITVTTFSFPLPSAECNSNIEQNFPMSFLVLKIQCFPSGN